MMKFIVTVLLLLIISVMVSAQFQETKPDEKNLYYMAFVAYLEKRNQMYEGNEDLRKRDYLNILVEHDLFITDGLPKTIGKNKIEYLGEVERREKLDKLREPYTLIVIRPMKNEGNKLVISFAEYRWSYKKNRVTYALSDGARVELGFDCQKSKFVIEKVELWGI